MRKIILSLAVLSLAVCSCTTDPYTGEKKVSNSALYSGGGALAGALVGQLAGGNTKATLIGAAVGAAAGGGLGYYLDNQESKLRAELKGTGVSVKREGGIIKLVMPGNITFASSDSKIQSSFYAVLNSVSKVFKEYKKTNITITGYTDSTGNEPSNKELSLSRAKSVADYFVGQEIAAKRIKVFGLGSANPVASNASSDGRSKNRRVEIEITATN